MNEPKTEQPVAWAREAAAKWRRKQNPDIARRINDREEDAYALGFKAGAAAADWENATHEDVVRMLHRTFARRALTWETNEGELGKIVASELRNVNDEWGKAMSGQAKAS